MEPSATTALRSLPIIAANASQVKEPTPCELLTPPHIDGAPILNSTGKVQYRLTGLQYEDGVNVCAFETYLTHGDAGDEVRIVVWLPLEPTTPWNGRFQGTGGGGLISGYFDPALGPTVAQGYAAVSGDAGVGRWGQSANEWGPDLDQLRLNTGHLNFHEMTVVRKAVTHDFYGREAAYSYFTGCSMGGRHGHALAQRYPHDYDGILSASPAPFWGEVGMQLVWPYITQRSGEGGFVGMCKLDALTKASIAACDDVGAGFIPHPPDCEFDAQSFVGETVECDNGTLANVTEYDASVWEAARLGPRDSDGSFLWHGLAYGAPFSPLAVEPQDFIPLLSEWVRNFVLNDAEYDIDTIELQHFPSLFRQSVADYDDLWGASDPDLTAFHKCGGKLLAWHGWSDERIPAEGSPHYWQKVKETLDANQVEIDDVYRLSMAPGALHCNWEVTGSEPNDLAILVKWVEEGEAPETLPQGQDRAFEKNCKHPKKISYCGSGDAEDPQNWDCI